MGNKRKTAPEQGPPPMYVEEEHHEDNGGQDYGQPYKFEADFSGPIRRRSCTDVLCLLLFLAFLGGWGFVAYFGISNGDINKVTHEGLNWP